MSNKLPYTKTASYNCFAVVVLASIVLQVVLSPFIASGQSDSALLWANGVYSVGLAIVALLYGRLVKADVVEVINVKKFDYKQLLFGLAFVVVLVNFMTPINNLLCDFIEWLGLKRPSVDIVINNETLPAVIIVAVLVAGVCEEFVFRGMIGNYIAQPFSWKGIAIGGALFSIFHMNPAQTLHQFVLGCVMLIALQRGGFITAVAMHIFNNLLAVVLSLTVETTGFYTDYWWQILIVSGVILAALCVVYVKVFPFKKQDQEVPAKQRSFPPVGFLVAVLYCIAMWVVVLFS